jgi:hypothetical protein
MPEFMKRVRRYVSLITGAAWVAVAVALVAAWQPEWSLWWWLRALLSVVALFLAVDSLRRLL